MVLFRELDVDVALLADLCADELILEARDEAVGADLQRVILALAAVECLAVNEALEVERREVAVFYLSAFRCIDELALAVLERLELLLDILIRDVHFVLRHVEALVVTELDFRTRRDRCLEDEVLALFQRLDVDARTRYRIDLLLIECLAEGLRSNDVESLLQDSILADVALDDHARSLALAEARDADAICEALACLLDCLVDLCCFDFNRQSDLLVLSIFYRNFHCVK